MLKLLSSIFCVLAFTTEAFAAEWVVGKEVEVEPGRYVTLFDSFNDWDVWKVETKNSTICKARKFETGKRQIPYGSIFFSSGAGLGLDLTREKETYLSLQHKTSSAYAGAEYRFSGERFPTDLEKASYVNYGDALLKNQAQFAIFKKNEDNVVSVYTSDWEYRAAKVGFEQLEAEIPLSGIIKAEMRLKECYNG